MELNEFHIYVIGLLATVLIWLVKRIQEHYGKPIPSGWLTTGVYLAAFGLALAFGLPAIPAFGAWEGPVELVAACLQWVSDILVSIGPIVGFATLIYNALLKRVLDGLGNRLLGKS